jgi:Glycosyl hydrolase family 52.
MGAHASFTCGAFGAKGGMGIELPGPYPGDINVGFFDADRTLHLLPLFEGSDGSESERYVEGKEGTKGKLQVIQQLQRGYGWASDCFRSECVDFEIVTPFFSLPDPTSAQPAELAFASCPVIHVNVHFRNSTNSPITGLFALGIDHRWSSLGQSTAGEMVGACSQERIGFASATEGANAFIDFDTVSAMNRQHQTPEFLLGPTAGLSIEIGPGESKTLSIVLGFYRQGVATYNRAMGYYYGQHFGSLIQALQFGLAHRDRYLQLAETRDRELAASGLSAEQQFLVAHATRGYYASTQWLWDGTQSVWVVNEGEYLMMNTFDLTVDMLFMEMRFNPWTVRNELEQFVARYAFYDQVFDPAAPTKLYPGGISFTHDMGVMNHWSPAGQSAYEVSGLDRACFSHMTCEQLTNWVLCAGVYIAQTNDADFLQRYERILQDCFTSLLNRDHPEADQRNGLMGFESARTLGGGEITTYDSLDHSLGQARNNIYLGGKIWASHVVLHHLFSLIDSDDLADQAKQAARRSAATLTAGFDPQLGYIPAVLDGENRSAIIPAIEALVYPYVMGLEDAVSEAGDYGDYIRVLKQHLTTILDDGLCLYEDGGWQLSSSADNSWASKIGLCQFVARKVLGFNFGEAQARADRAHVRWQQLGAPLSACSDQFRSGVAHGSLYYPRVITNILWLTE